MRPKCSLEPWQDLMGQSKIAMNIAGPWTEAQTRDRELMMNGKEELPVLNLSHDRTVLCTLVTSNREANKCKNPL